MIELDTVCLLIRFAMQVSMGAAWLKSLVHKDVAEMTELIIVGVKELGLRSCIAHDDEGGFSDSHRRLLYRSLIQRYNTLTMIAIYLREIVFGFEDSFVSTLGTITGIAVGTHSARIVVLSGLVLILVEAVSMAAGSYIAAKTQAEVEATHHRRGAYTFREHPFLAGLIMFFSYVVGGAVPLLPYFFLSVTAALWPSIALTVIALFLLGAWKAHYTKRSWWKSGTEMVVVCALAALLGYVVGAMLGRFFAAAYG